MRLTNHHIGNKQIIINKNLKPNIPNPKINLRISLQYQAHLSILHQHQ